jgi:hypothetical protein
MVARAHHTDGCRALRRAWQPRCLAAHRAGIARSRLCSLALITPKCGLPVGPPSTVVKRTTQEFRVVWPPVFVAVAPPNECGLVASVAAPGQDRGWIPVLVSEQDDRLRPRGREPVRVDELALRNALEHGLDCHADYDNSFVYPAIRRLSANTYSTRLKGSWRRDHASAACPSHPPDRRRTDPAKITVKGARRASHVTRVARP